MMHVGHGESLTLALQMQIISSSILTRTLHSKYNMQVEGLVRLMESEHVGPFNLGNPGEFTMLELAEV